MSRYLQEDEYSPSHGTFQDAEFVIEFDWQGDNAYYAETKKSCFVITSDGRDYFRMPGCSFTIHEVKSILRLMELKWELGFKHGQLAKAGEIRKALEVVD